MSKSSANTGAVKIPKPVLIEIEKLIPHPQNLKDHPKSQVETLTKLIKLVGFKDPIVIDKKFNVKAGHGRLLAAKKLNMKKVPCIYIENLTKKQMDLFMYLDNYVNESPWIADNVELIFDEMPKVELEEWPEVNWDNIIPQTEIVEEPIPEPPKKPKSKLGDIYLLGNHRVMCGDSIKDADKFITKPAKITITSPPYNLGINAKITGVKFSKYKNNSDNNPDYSNFLNDFTNIFLKKSNFVFVNLQQLANNKIQFIEYLYEFRHNFVDRIIWDKETAIPHIAQNVLNSQFEDILIFKNAKNPSKSIDSGSSFQGSISNIHKGTTKKESIQKEHHAVFPLHLPQFIINNFSKKNDIILDPFLGTGTTLIACEQTNRICFGMELDPSYISVILDRWSNYTNKDPIRLSDGKKWSKIKEE